MLTFAIKKLRGISGLLNLSFQWCFVETQQNSSCECLLFLLGWLCKYILNRALRVYLSRAVSILCHVFTFFFLAVDHMHGSLALFLFLAVLPSGHLPPLSPRRSFCFARTQWPSGSGTRGHPLLHGLLKNPSLNAAWYVLVFLVESCFWGLSVRNHCLRCLPNLSLSRRVRARPCSAWKCGYNQKSSWKPAPGFHASSLANMTVVRLKDKNFVLLPFSHVGWLAIQLRVSNPKRHCFDCWIFASQHRGGWWCVDTDIQAESIQLVLSSHTHSPLEH